MRRTVALGILFSIILFGTAFLNCQVPIAKSANFVGETIYLRADGSIEPSDAPVDVHGSTYTLTGSIQCPRGLYCIQVERSGILLDGDGYTIEGWDPQNEPSLSGTGINVGFENNVEIRNIIITGCVYGIQMQSVSGINIHNTTVDGQFKPEKAYEAYGINLLSCDETSVYQNNLVNNYIGILIQSSNCTIGDNRIMDNAGSGVTMHGSTATFISNIIARNDLGMEIRSSNSLIENNDILSNKRIGVSALDGLSNTFIGNNIAGHNGTDGFGIQMGPYEGNNTFYHNDFENNRIHVEGGDFAAIANIWDNGYPSGGNYWDTYQGLDSYMGSDQNQTGNDGLGDTPFQITQANTDRYPLMEPVRPIPDIGEATIIHDDYTLAIVIAFVIILCLILTLFIFYWRRRKKEALKEPYPSAQGALVVRFIVTVLLTLSIMIILNFAFITAGTYQLGSVELYGGALYFDEILIGFLSSIAGFFLTWIIIIKQDYRSGGLAGILQATLTSALFVTYILGYTAYHQFEMFGLLQYMQPNLVTAWTFTTTLIGCFLGFWLGGFGLKRMQDSSHAPVKSEKRELLSYSRLASGAILVFAGFLTGYAAGYIVWAFIGQVQVMLGGSFPYASEFPPPLIFLLVWAVLGALVFPLAILVKRTNLGSAPSTN